MGKAEPDVVTVAVAVAVKVTVTVIVSLMLGKAKSDAVTVTVTETVSLVLGEVEPDVRLNITLPAWTGNGAELPRVLLTHSFVTELPNPQQKVEPSRYGKGKIPIPQFGLTRDGGMSVSESCAGHNLNRLGEQNNSVLKNKDRPTFRRRTLGDIPS